MEREWSSELPTWSSQITHVIYFLSCPSIQWLLQSVNNMIDVGYRGLRSQHKLSLLALF